MFRHVDLHIFCSSYTKMFVGKDPSTTGGFLWHGGGVGTLIGSGGVGIFCVGPVFERAMGLGQENLWNDFDLD